MLPASRLPVHWWRGSLNLTPSLFLPASHGHPTPPPRVIRLLSLSPVSFQAADSSLHPTAMSVTPRMRTAPRTFVGAISSARNAFSLISDCFLLILQVSFYKSPPQRPHPTPIRLTQPPKTSASHPILPKYALSLLDTHTSSPLPLPIYFLLKMQLHIHLCLYLSFCPLEIVSSNKTGLCSQPDLQHLAQCLVQSKRAVNDKFTNLWIIT